MYFPTLTRYVFPNFGYSHYANYLPYKNVYNDNSLEDINKVEEYSIDASEQSYVDGNPKKIYFDNPNWNVQPENQSYTDALAIVIAVISIVVLIVVVYFILRFLRVI